MDDKELIEWLRTSGSDLDPCLDAADTIERLQRELATASEMIASMQAQRNQAAREREEQWQARAKAERERDEALAELEKIRRTLLYDWPDCVPTENGDWEALLIDARLAEWRTVTDDNICLPCREGEGCGCSVGDKCLQLTLLGAQVLANVGIAAPGGEG